MERIGARRPLPAARQSEASRAPAAPVRADDFERARAVRLQRGMVGPAVRVLQERLVRAGAMPAADATTGPGVFGPRTEAAVRRFQAALGLAATGAADARTLAALASGQRVGGARPTAGDTFTDEITQPMGTGVRGDE